MKRDLVILVAALALSIVEVGAQVTKRVEVTKAYTPEVGAAKKLIFEPDMVDTVAIRPDIDYSITPRSIESRLSQSLYQPMIVPLSDTQMEESESLYAKIGLGAPFSSVLDAYYSMPLEDGGYVMGYFNHSGSYGDRDDIYGKSTNATQSQNVLGVAARKSFEEKDAEANVYYVHDLWDRYATAMSDDNDHARYQRLGFSGSYGDDYSDWSRWNYAANVGVDGFWATDSKDVISMDLGVNAGRELGMGNIYLGAKLYMANGSDSYKNKSFSIESSYTFSLNKLDFKLGAVYLHDVVEDDLAKNKDNKLLPNLKIRSNHLVWFKPFVEIDTKLQRNDFASLSDINPYILPGMYLNENSITYNYRAGIEGDLLDQKLTYRAYTQFSTSEDAVYYWFFATPTLTTGVGNRYGALLDDKDALSLNLDTEYRPSNNLKVNMAMSLTHYSGSNLEVGEPKFEMSLGTEYKVDKLTIGVGLDYMSKRYNDFVDSSYNSSRIEAPQAFNLKASAELRLKKNIAVFADLNNLLSDDIYRWAGYKEYGASIMAGVKIQF